MSPESVTARMEAERSLAYWYEQAANAQDKKQTERCNKCMEYVAHYESDLRYWKDLEHRYQAQPSRIIVRKPPLKFGEIICFPYYCFFLVIHTMVIMFGWMVFAIFIFAVLYAIFGG